MRENANFKAKGGVFKNFAVFMLVNLMAVPLSGTVTDYDGNVYQTVGIGYQLWMAENLKVTHYRNDDAIPNVTVNADWAELSTGA